MLRHRPIMIKSLGWEKERTSLESIDHCLEKNQELISREMGVGKWLLFGQ